MEDETIDRVNRRDFLTTATVVVGGCGIGLAAIPFIKSMSPARDIIAAGVIEVDLADIKEGECRVIMWRKQPLFILRRTPAMIDAAGAIDSSRLRDPATPEERVLRPELLVCIGICTHLGCIPRWEPKGIAGLDQPGFYCPCHGGKYDTLGRRLDGPPPENLHLVPYTFTAVNKLRIGTAKFAGFSENIRKIPELPKA